nr:Hpt domain-containing protein [Marinibactrum halimedae]
MAALNELFGDEPEFQRELLQEFCQSSQAYSDEMLQAWEEKSFDKVCSVAHKLKSSAGTIGAIELEAICQRLEEAGKEQDRETVQTLVPNIQPQLQRIADYVAEIISSEL